MVQVVGLKPVIKKNKLADKVSKYHHQTRKITEKEAREPVEILSNVYIKNV